MLRKSVIVLFAVLLILPQASILSWAVMTGSALSPAPAKPEKNDLLLRWTDQTEFANYEFTRPMMLEKAALSKGGGAGDNREIQESDVFKIGKKGSKLLYLLNGYRGLQAVSFKDGIRAPKLLGDSEATGNHPEEMYYDSKNELMYVLEKYWYDTSGNDAQYRNRSSRILVYNVANPAKIEEMKALTTIVQGEVVDSRIVGNVLYVATTEWPDGWWNNNNVKVSGNIFSFKLTAKGVEKIAHHKMTYPIGYFDANKMNVIKSIDDNDGAKYYLVAVEQDLAQNTSWWDRKSVVEVFDITDAAGVIKPVLAAKVKGQILERSGTYIKNNTLVTVSNVRSEEDQKLRISAETFTFPGASPKVLTPEDVAARVSKLKLEISKAKTPSEKAKAEAKLMEDAELTLKNVFASETANSDVTVAASPESLRRLVKLYPDSQVLLGDDRGQNASLQDVRVSGKLLYVFWVPADKVDPLDIIDIDAPEKGIAFLGRTPFEGWVSHSVAISTANQEFILGLGWINPAVGVENFRRKPQAILFEVKKMGGTGKFVAEKKGEIILAKGDDNIWTDFNQGDKFIETRFDETGTKGTVLFQASYSGNGKWLSGGKLLGFDVNKASNNTGDVFREGGFLVGDSGWLKRIFTNPEIEAINTFSDTTLGTFDIKKSLSESSISEAVSILELARDVRGFASIKNKGVQILGNYGYGMGEKAHTTLRMTAANRADAEAAEVGAGISLPGNYVSHSTSKDGNELYVLTKDYTYVAGKDSTPAQYFEDYWLGKLVVENDKPVLKSEKLRIDMNPKPGPMAANGANTARGSASEAPPMVVHPAQQTRMKLKSPTERIKVSVTASSPALKAEAMVAGANRSMMPRRSYHVDSLELLASGDLSAVLSGRLYTVSVKSGAIAFVPLNTKGCIPENAGELRVHQLSDEMLAEYSVSEASDIRDYSYKKLYFVKTEVKNGTLVCKSKPTNIPGKLVSVNKDTLITQDSFAGGWQQYFGEEGKTLKAPIEKTALLSLAWNEKEGKAKLVSDHELRGVETNQIQEAGGVLHFFKHEEMAQSGWLSWRFSPRRFVQSARFVAVSVDAQKRLSSFESTPILEGESSYVNLAKVAVDSASKTCFGLAVSARTGRVLKWSLGEKRPNPEVLKVDLVKGLDAAGPKLEATKSFPVLEGWRYSYGNGSDRAIHYNSQQKSFEIAEGLYGVTQVWVK